MECRQRAGSKDDGLDMSVWHLLPSAYMMRTTNLRDRSPSVRGGEVQRVMNDRVNYMVRDEQIRTEFVGASDQRFEVDIRFALIAWQMPLVGSRD